MSRKRLIDQLGDKARQLSVRAARELFSSDRRAVVVGEAVRRAQDARTRVDEQSARMLAAMGFATAADLERVSRKVGRLRKRLRGILDQLDG
jgi:hypothetical protein